MKGFGMAIFRPAVLALALALTGGWTAAHAGPACTLVAEAEAMADAESPADGNPMVRVRLGDACAVRFSPASSFKIPLALMGYDLGLLVDEHTPALPYKDEYDAPLEEWKQTTDPAGWMRRSVVWYSQELTRAMGMDRFGAYVEAFGYGNGNLSGDEEMDNGLTHAWLSSSLAISPDEQLAFLGRLWHRHLPVAATAYDRTLAIVPSFEAGDGWRVWGKTGTGHSLAADGTRDQTRQFGWFVGWAEREGAAVLFVRLIQDDGPEETAAGARARDGFLSDLPHVLKAP